MRSESEMDVDEYFQGEKLYGNDFTLDQIKIWCQEEEEGYAGVILDNGKNYTYDYHGLNQLFFFTRFPIKNNSKALGLGSALGHEFLPIIDKLDSINIIDPSNRFSDQHVLQGKKVIYTKPSVNGNIAYADESFDLITCFGVLHHIANVSDVLSECYRCLKPGGLMFCREPIVTQGDWRQPRLGLTKNERGIPVQVFKKMVRDVGFCVKAANLFDFAPYTRAMYQIGYPAFRKQWTVRLDRILSKLFSFNTIYHRITFLQKFGPASLALVLTKAK